MHCSGVHTVSRPCQSTPSTQATQAAILATLQPELYSSVATTAHGEGVCACLRAGPRRSSGRPSGPIIYKFARAPEGSMSAYLTCTTACSEANSHKTEMHGSGMSTPEGGMFGNLTCTTGSEETLALQPPSACNARMAEQDCGPRQQKHRQSPAMHQSHKHSLLDAGSDGVYSPS